MLTLDQTLTAVGRLLTGCTFIKEKLTRPGRQPGGITHWRSQAGSTPFKFKIIGLLYIIIYIGMVLPCTWRYEVTSLWCNFLDLFAFLSSHHEKATERYAISVNYQGVIPLSAFRNGTSELADLLHRPTIPLMVNVKTGKM